MRGDMRFQTWIFLVSIACTPAAADSDSAAAAAARVARGGALFMARCASCHDPAIERAPSKTALARRFPDDIAGALKSGKMQPMAADLSDEDIHSIAEYLGADGMTERAADPPACASHGKFSMSGPGWNGWSIDAANSRAQPDPGFASADVPRLKVKMVLHLHRRPLWSTDPRGRALVSHQFERPHLFVGCQDRLHALAIRC